MFLIEMYMCFTLIHKTWFELSARAMQCYFRNCSLSWIISISFGAWTQIQNSSSAEKKNLLAHFRFLLKFLSFFPFCSFIFFIILLVCRECLAGKIVFTLVYSERDVRIQLFQNYKFSLKKQMITSCQFQTIFCKKVRYSHSVLQKLITHHQREAFQMLIKW